MTSMIKMEGYCPICNEIKILLYNNDVSFSHCPECGHHLSLKPIEEITTKE